MKRLQGAEREYLQKVKYLFSILEDAMVHANEVSGPFPSPMCVLP